MMDCKKALGENNGDVEKLRPSTGCARKGLSEGCQEGRPRRG
jgi:translation elongation factor EF-Ts